jgi:hypothetical protein
MDRDEGVDMTRRSAFGLAAILTATIATGAFAVAGIRQHAPATAAPIVRSVVATAAHRAPAPAGPDRAEAEEAER